MCSLWKLQTFLVFPVFSLNFVCALLGFAFLSWILFRILCILQHTVAFVIFLNSIVILNFMLPESPKDNHIIARNTQPKFIFPTYYGTRRFITAFTSARYLSLSWASLIQSTTPHSTSWKYILTLILLTWKIRWAPYNASKWQMGFNSGFQVLISSHLSLGLPSCPFPSGFPTRTWIRSFLGWILFHIRCILHHTVAFVIFLSSFVILNFCWLNGLRMTIW